MRGHVLGSKPAAVAALGPIEHSLSNGVNPVALKDGARRAILVASRDVVASTSMVEIKDRFAHGAESPLSRPHAKIGTCFVILAGAECMLVSFNKPL